MKQVKTVLTVIFVLAIMAVMVAAPFAEANPGAMSGKVTETMNSGGYTYVQIDQGGQKMWFAVPQTSIKVGDQVAFQPGSMMQNFTSKSLKRTFDTIIFSGGIIK